MLKDRRFPGERETLDLETMRETLAYIHDDVRRAHGLEAAAAALATAIGEIDRANARPRASRGGRPFTSARYLRLKH